MIDFSLPKVERIKAAINQSKNCLSKYKLNLNSGETLIINDEGIYSGQGNIAQDNFVARSWLEEGKRINKKIH
jgi:hypothetical protein